MRDSQIKYIAVNLLGKITGPIGDNPKFVKKVLIEGYRRAKGFYPTFAVPWETIERLGYSVKKLR